MKKRKLKVGDLKKFQRTILFPETLNLGSKIFSPQKYFLEVSKQRPGFFVFESVFFFISSSGGIRTFAPPDVCHTSASRNMHPFLLGGSNLCFIVGKALNEASANTLISVMRKKIPSRHNLLLRHCGILLRHANVGNIILGKEKKKKKKKVQEQKQKQAAARKFEFESKAVFFFESDDLFRQ